MRVLLDESVPRALGFLIEGHLVRTVQVAGFAGLLNGELLAAMKAAGFDALVTFDQKSAVPAERATARCRHCFSSSQQSSRNSR